MLPSRFPNLLVNGSQGIAVGMATNIPPHNLGEVIDATSMLDHPEATSDELMQFVKGPDFPTGGQILGRAGHPRRLPDRPGVGEAPGGRRDRRIEKRRDPDHRHGDALPDVRGDDRETDRRGRSRLAISAASRRSDNLRPGASRASSCTLKRDANANVVLNNLYKHTPMQMSFGDAHARPRRRGAPARRPRPGAQRLRRAPGGGRDAAFAVPAEAARDRAHIVEGLLRAIDMLDEVIATIRDSEDRADARRTSWRSRSRSRRTRRTTSST